MAYFDCIVGGSGKGNTLVVTCADDLAGATITCTNGTKTYTKTCPSTAPYEVTFYGLEAGTWTISATVSGNTYTTTVVIADHEAELGGFSWRAWVDLSQNYTSSDFTDLDDLLSDETAIRELMTIHTCVDYLASSKTSPDVETIINNDLCAKWINLRDYALDTLYANEIIAGYMDTADKYGYGEWARSGYTAEVPTMTSATTPSGEVYGSPTSMNSPYVVFDGNSANGWLPLQSVTEPFIAYRFTSKKIITGFDIQFMNVARDIDFNVYIEGSDDNTTWNLIATISDCQFQSSSKQVFRFENDTEYLYIRARFNVPLYVTNQYNAYVQLMQFYTGGNWQPKGNVPVMTSNTIPYGTVSASGNATDHEPFKAFCGGIADGRTWQVNSSSAWIKYKFTNPVCVKAYRAAQLPASPRTLNLTLQGSNNDSTWENIEDSSASLAPSNYNVVTNATNDKYYLYYRVSCSSSDSYCVLAWLQFYGRELSGLVPPMISNTLPSGVASAENLNTSSYAAYYVFDKNEGTTWVPSTIDAWIGYKFPSAQIIKGLYIYNVSTSNRPFTAILKGSNDGNVWTELKNGISILAGDRKYISIDNTNAYKYYRLYTHGTNGMGALINEMQFYGLDYTEREFEEGSTKKWLYDHGVELEEITTFNTSSASVVKNSDSIIYSANGTSSDTTCAGFRTTNKINLSSYSLVRLAVGKIVNIGTSILLEDNVQYYVGLTPEAAIILAANMLPRDISLAVSSVNQERYVQAAVYRNGLATEAVEMWLE